MLKIYTRIFWLLGLYFFVRIGFYYAQENLYVNLSRWDIGMAFLRGIRFDLAALFWISSLNILIIGFITSRLERRIFVSLHFVFFVFSVVDLELFHFNGKRLSKEFFLSLGPDILAQLPQLIFYYWPLSMGCLFFLFLFNFAIKKSDNWSERKFGLYPQSWWFRVFVTAILGFMSFIFIRGGLQSKSLSVQSAFISGQHSLGQLTLNTPYYFLRTWREKNPQIKWVFRRDQLVEHLSRWRSLELEKRKIPFVKTHHGETSNVVLIILESFSQEYVDLGYTPFLSELSKKSLVFKTHFANGRRSIEALPSLFLGIPSVLNDPLAKSSAQSMALQSLPKLLKQKGYSTAFLHGANRESMGFERFCLSHGIDTYFARENYPGPKNHDDKKWGIYDGPWFDFALAEMNNFKGPFFAGIFTLSSHQPYAVPEPYIQKIPKGHLEIHQSIRYTDEILRQFFEKAQKTPWFKNTLFVLTADHTSKLETPAYQNSVGLYRVPLLFFSPSETFKGLIEGLQHLPADGLSQHIDIPHTILDFLNISPTGLPLGGRSLFRPGSSQVLHFLNPDWQWLTQESSQVFTSSEEGKAQKNTPQDFEILKQYWLQSLKDQKWLMTFE